MASKKATIIYFRCGGGHITTAKALYDELQDKSYGIDPAIVDLRDILDLVDPFKWTGIKIENIYNYLLRKGVKFGLEALLRFGQTIIRRHTVEFQLVIDNYIEKTNPDIIVSVIPNFNNLLAVTAIKYKKPFVTVMSDFVDQAPHFWEEPDFPQTQILMRPSLGGCVVHPDFYKLWSKGLKQKPTNKLGLVMFGGYGSKDMLTIAQELNGINVPDLELVFICGQNTKLYRKLTKLSYKKDLSYKLSATGTIVNIPYWMQNADFIMGKPGPGMISEAVVSNLPIITTTNAMFQEKPNAYWVQQQDIGIVVKDWIIYSGLHYPATQEAVKDILNQSRYKQNITNLKNNMLYDVCNKLKEL